MAGEEPIALEWKEWDLERNTPVSWVLGPLKIWAVRTETEWVLTWIRCPDAAERDGTPAPAPAGWMRWTAPEKSYRLKFEPCLPPSTLVAKPENSFRILAGERARVYVSVPIWVRISLADEPGSALVEVPGEILSNTWGGKLTAGELCLWTRTRARRTFDPAAVPAHIVTAPLVLANRSKSDLLVEKMHVRLPFLGIFAGDGLLWTDTSHIIYKGPTEYETVQEEGEPPKECPGGARLASPRSAPKSGLAALSFSPMQALSEWGF